MILHPSLILSRLLMMMISLPANNLAIQAVGGVGGAGGRRGSVQRTYSFHLQFLSAYILAPLEGPNVFVPGFALPLNAGYTPQHAVFNSSLAANQARAYSSAPQEEVSIKCSLRAMRDKVASPSVVGVSHARQALHSYLLTIIFVDNHRRFHCERAHKLYKSEDSCL